MKLVTVSSKRQITLSKSDLDELQVLPGGKLIAEKFEKGIYLTAAPLSVVDEVAGSLRPYISKDKLNTSDEEIMTSTRKLVAKKIAEK